jgi:hypothetical protein
MTTSHLTSSTEEIPCRCCGGTGIQTRNDGIKIVCPACGGSGHWPQIVVYPVPYEVPVTAPTWPSYPQVPATPWDYPIVTCCYGSKP